MSRDMMCAARGPARVYVRQAEEKAVWVVGWMAMMSYVERSAVLLFVY